MNLTQILIVGGVCATLYAISMFIHFQLKKRRSSKNACREARIKMKGVDETSSVIINGQEFSGVGDVSVVDGVITIGGVRQNFTEYGDINITVVGNVEFIGNTAGNITAHNVGKIEVTTGDVHCSDVAGNIEITTGDVICNTVKGDIEIVSGSVKKNLFRA